MRSNTRSMFALSAALLVGLAVIEPSNRRIATLFLIPAIAITGVAVFARREPSHALAERLSRLAPVVAVLGGFALFVQSFLHVFGALDEPADFVAAVAAIMVGVGAIGLFVGDRPRLAWTVFLLAYSVVIAILLVLTKTDFVLLDVALFQQDSVAALVRGVNPYSITFVDPYDAVHSALFYGDGVSVDGVLQFGYPYFPLSLVVIVPFEAFFDDFRIAHAVAVVASGLLMSRLVPGDLGRRAGALFLLVAPALGLVRLGWMDPLVVLFAVLVVFAALRSTRTGSFATGLLVAMKQYATLFVIPSLLLLGRPLSLRAVVAHLARAGLAFIVVTLPFAFWDPASFYRSVVELQFLQPFRPDSIAFPALVADWFESLPRSIAVGVPLAIVVIVSIAVVLRGPTGAQGFALGSALILLVFFSLSKQAFANYYIVVIGLLCAGAAAAQDGDDSIGGSPSEALEAIVS